MATIVNTPPAQSSNSNGFLLGVILLVILAVLFLYWGLPALRAGVGTVGGGTSVNIPDKVDVNVQHSQ